MLADLEFWKRLSERIADDRERQVARLISGNLTLDAYKMTVGSIQALDYVLKEAQIVHDDMMGIRRQTEEDDE